MKPIRELVSIASLFTSFSTLLCCALPSLLVAIGLGAAVAGVFSGLPWLNTLVKHHNFLFLVAGIVLVFNGWLLFRKRTGEVCLPAANETGETACATAHRWNFWIFGVSIGLFLIGVTVTYILPAVLF